ncbi:uncharacterized protein LOC132197354 [Neocloeon triangulifer]|uniref:uncharacterized protein LOC132197354 n=1 Tax=Neocloeon triangulifer TaxID=2078957 RepID=UPI00286F3FB6|nr:uncharacterized protein LOC132197354 [Neocloeon triangulifer]
MGFAAWTLLLVAYVLVWSPTCDASDWPVQLGIQLIRENVAGLPVVHDKQSFPFNPDEGLVRRDLFTRTFGFRGENLIKALGEGDGGYAKPDDGQRTPYLPFRTRQIFNGLGKDGR